MKVTFRGVRGSLPSPGPGTVRYGGNTTCVELRTDDNELIILDAGTGIFPLAQTLLKQLPVTCSIFITHTHWDHIQGLPFFIPLFVPNSSVHIYGPVDPVSRRGIGDLLGRQMEYCFFPVREAELKADIRYTTLSEMQTVEVGSARITPILMNHPGLCLGYRIECSGKTIFFTGDNEPLYNIYAPGDDYYAEYEDLIAEKKGMLADFIRNADLLIADAAYTAREYPLKKGWGHGTFDSCIELARDAGAKSLCFTHHEPLRTDDDLDDLFRQLRERYPLTSGAPPFCIAYEGLEISV